MSKLIIFILTLLPVFSYSQVTSINIDTSASQVIIINNGTMIENNGGTVNLCNESTEPANQDCNRLPLVGSILIMLIIMNVIGLNIDAFSDCRYDVLNLFILCNIVGLILGVIFYLIN